MRASPDTDADHSRDLHGELELRAAELHALARQLVGDQDAADIVQETASLVLRRPPEHASSLRGWLRTVVRGVAHNHLRASRRRSRRERDAARPEGLPDTVSLVAQRDALRNLTDSLLALDEPYRRTLLLRYFHDRTPVEIARGEGVPVATVKSRLQRGLARMRTRLNDRDPHWPVALCGLFRLSPASTAPFDPLPVVTTKGAALGKGILLISKFSKTAAWCGLLILAMFAAALAFDMPQPAAPTSTGAIRSRQALVDSRDAAPPVPAERRSVIADASSLVPDLDHPYSFELRCRVIDADGDPVANRVLALAILEGAWNIWPTMTDFDGEVVLAWHGKRANACVALGVVDGARVDGPRRLEITAGTPLRQTLLAEQVAPCPLTAPEAADCTDCHRSGDALPDASREPIGATLHPFARLRALGPAPRRDIEDLARTGERFQIPLRPGPMPLFVGPARPDAFLGLRRLLSERKALRSSGEVGAIEGVVFGPDGEPRDGLIVRAGPYASLPGGRVETHGGGRFRFEGLPAGTCQLRCSTGQDGCAGREVEVRPGAAAFADLQLDPGLIVSGRILGGSDDAADWSVEFRADDGSWVDVAPVDPTGNFRLTNQPGVSGTLLLVGRRGAGLPVAWSPGIVPGGPPIELDLGRDGRRARGALTAQVGPWQPEIRVWQTETGRGVVLSPGEDGNAELGGLPAGWYEVELGAPGVGWRSLPPVWVDGAHPSSLGVLEPGEPAELELASARDESTPLELFHRTEAGDRLAARVELPSDQRLLLPPGTWLALWSDRDGQLLGSEFGLRAGRTTRLTEAMRRPEPGIARDRSGRSMSSDR